MNQDPFSKEYEIVQEYGLKVQNTSAIKMYEVKKKINALKCKTPELLISVHFPIQLVDDNFQRLRRFKYINIIQPEAHFSNVNNQYILIYLDYLKFQLNQEKMKQFSDKDIIRVFLQLVLFYAELEKRKLKWPLEFLEQLYFIDGLVYISLADYNFKSQNLQFNCYQQLVCFTKKYFPVQQRQFIQNNFKNFEQAVKHFCQQEINSYNIQNKNNQNHYENVLKYLLNIEKFDRVNEMHDEANSDVMKFKTPLNLLELHPELRQTDLKEEQECIYKATKLYGDDEQIIQKRIDREIENMEQNESNFTVVFSLYFRILEQPYLIMKKMKFTLQDVLKDWNPTEENLKKDVYSFAYKFARALHDLHYNKKLLHRDLKQDNLFLDLNDLQNSDILIGDLDRAKSNQQIIEQTYNHQGNQKKYSPPEQDVDDQKISSYDVFQYGIIVLEVANKNQYIGGDPGKGPVGLDRKEFNDFYSLEALQFRLSKLNYDKEFIDLISNCLQYEPKKRYDPQQIYEITEKLYQQVLKKKQQQEIIFDQRQVIDQVNIIQYQQNIVNLPNNQDLENKIKKLQLFLQNHFGMEKENQQK